MPIFAFRAKMGQEKSLAQMAEIKGGQRNSGVYAVLLAESLKGYAFVEGVGQLEIETALGGIRTISARAVRDVEVPIEELSDLLNPRPAIEGLELGAIVQIIDGPFKGLKAKLTRVEDASQEITVELLDSTMSLPVRIHADYVKKLTADTEERKKKEFGKFNL